MSSNNPANLPKPLAGKVALVTGASRGIGRAIALRLAALGAKTVVNYLRSEADANATVDAIEAAGGMTIAIQADLSDVSEVRRLFAETLAWGGRLDILVNNAAYAKFDPIADVREEDFDALFALNVKGLFFALQEAARVLADNGRIINISSGVTIAGGAGSSVYAGTKGAVEQFTLAAAKELGRKGITVNTVSPGVTETDMMRAVLSEEYIRKSQEESSLGRIGRPEDIADIVGFLATEEARWITGQNIRANGGRS